jgi:peptide/nickel transport system substrate-binding protein
MRARQALAAAGAIVVAVGMAACNKTTNKGDSDKSGGSTSPHVVASGAIATDPKDSMGPAAPVPGATAGGTIYILRETQISHLDPQRTYSFAGLLTSQLFARRLTTFKDDGKGHVTLVGDLATTPGTDVNKDCKTWKYTLKDGVKFQDGSTITSKDVAYGIARSFDLDLTGGPTYLQEWLADSDQFDKVFNFKANKTALPPGLTTPDDKTIQFSFKHPHCDLPFAASLPASAPMPASKDTGTNYDKQPFSSGPYMITKNTVGTEIDFAKNPYWDPKTDAVRHQYPDKYIWQFGADYKTQTNRIVADNGADSTAISWNGPDPSQIQSVTTNASLKSRILSGPTPDQTVLAINNKRVTDLATRQALNYAIDRTGFIQAIGGPAVAEPVTTLMPPSTIGWQNYDAYPAGARGNIEKAKQVLGGKHPNLVLVVRDTSFYEQEGTQLKNNLEKAGFKITMKTDSDDSYLDDIKKSDNPWDLYVTDWAADWPSGAAILPILYDGRTIKTGGSNNDESLFNDPSFSSEFDRIQTLPIEQQGPEWAKLDKAIMTKDAPVVPLYVTVFVTVMGSKVGGMFLDSIWGNPGLTNAYVKK